MAAQCLFCYPLGVRSKVVTLPVTWAMAPSSSARPTAEWRAKPWDAVSVCWPNVFVYVVTNQLAKIFSLVFLPRPWWQHPCSRACWLRRSPFPWPSCGRRRCPDRRIGRRRWSRRTCSQIPQQIFWIRGQRGKPTTIFVSWLNSCSRGRHGYRRHLLSLRKLAACLSMSLLEPAQSQLPVPWCNLDPTQVTQRRPLESFQVSKPSWFLFL